MKNLFLPMVSWGIYGTNCCAESIADYSKVDFLFIILLEQKKINILHAFYTQ